MAKQKVDCRVTACSSTDEFSVVADSTRGDGGTCGDFPLYGQPNPLASVLRVVPEVKDARVCDQLKKLLSAICRTMPLLPAEAKAILGRDSHLAAHVEGDSVLLEWMFPDFRIGFNVEPNPDESGWHLISNRRLGELTASGQLVDIGETVVMLLRFILANT